MKTILIFPGQGCQKIGMAKDFYDADAAVRELFEEASDRCGIDFCALLFEPNERIDESCFTQPAILLASMAALRYVSARAALEPAGFLGHSLGEFTACCAAGLIAPAAAAALVHERGKFMAECARPEEPASMLVALGLRDADAEYIADALRKNQRQIWAANYNCDGQIVLAGLRADLEHAAGLLKDAGAKRAMLLNMSVASHCPLMQPAAERLAPLLEREFSGQASAPIIANATAEAYADAAGAIEALKAQLVRPVLYKQSIAKLCAEAVAEAVADGSPDAPATDNAAESIRFIEFGASVLAGLNKKITPARTFSIATLADAEAFISAANAEGERA